MKKSIIYLIFFAVLFMPVCLYAGDSVMINMSVSAYNPETVKVAVLNLEGNTERYESELPGGKTWRVDNAGELVADGVASMLLSFPDYKVIERDQVKHILEEQDLQMTDIIKNKSVQEVGNILGCDAVVLGNVIEYFSWQEFVFWGTDLSFNIRLVDVKTGTVIWSASVSIRKNSGNAGAALIKACTLLKRDLEKRFEDVKKKRDSRNRVSDGKIRKRRD
ncbi:CsgG/HfaB family protein [bacterium]|nr:CsgG/HfaB family protein [bacterium]